ncbi:hypothetical protein Landi51_01809 [Colletotrichum acutatum]
MIGGILRPKSLLLFPLFLTTTSLHFGSARRRHCGLDSRSSSVLHSRHHIHTADLDHHHRPIPLSTSPIQSRSLQNQQQGTVTRLLDLETRIADALPRPVSQHEQSSLPNGDYTATSNRPGEWPATDFSSSTPPNVSIILRTVFGSRRRVAASHRRRAILVTELSGFTVNKRRSVETVFVPFSTYISSTSPPTMASLTLHPTRYTATTRQAVQVSKTCLQPADSSLQTQLFPQLFTVLDHAQRPYAVQPPTPELDLQVTLPLPCTSTYSCMGTWGVSGHEPLLGYDCGRDTAVAPAPHPHAAGHTPAVHPPWPLPSFFAAHPSAVTATPQCHAEHPAPPPATRVRRMWEGAS